MDKPDETEGAGRGEMMDGVGERTVQPTGRTHRYDARATGNHTGGHVTVGECDIMGDQRWQQHSGAVTVVREEEINSVNWF